MMQERTWLIPSIMLTLVSAITAVLVIPMHSGLLPAMQILPAWMAASLTYLTWTSILIQEPAAPKLCVGLSNYQ
ncbi:MAG: hypothetical protein EOO38_31310 [Cytophagaceae bacterium]|nr:MAG: hypothetical protein EOO38_31310 [Cytophagaceae bacterium]